MVNIEEQIKRLREALYGFFEGKFTSNGFNINASVSDKGYYMTYRGVEYSMDFVYDDNLGFNMEVILPKKNETLEERLDEERVSNRQLNMTKYLSDQKINTNGFSVSLSCRLKKIPEDRDDISKVIEQLWGSIIKRAMRAVYG